MTFIKSLQGSLRLRAKSTEQPASAGREDPLRALYGLVPAEALTLYQYGKAQLAIEPGDDRVIGVAWIALVVAIALRWIGTMPKGGGAPQPLTIIFAVIALVLLVIMDGGAFWIGGAAPNNHRPYWAIAAAGLAAIAAAAAAAFVEPDR